MGEDNDRTSSLLSLVFMDGQEKEVLDSAPTSHFNALYRGLMPSSESTDNIQRKSFVSGTAGTKMSAY